MAGLIAGAALLGNWINYRPVLYRLFYEKEGDGGRGSLLVLSRLGFLAVTAALSYKYNANRAILSIIAPLTLITVGKDSAEKIKESLRIFPNEFCSHIIAGLMDTASTATSCEPDNYLGKIIYFGINNCNDVHKIRLKSIDEQRGCGEEKELDVRGSKELIVIKKMQCRPLPTSIHSLTRDRDNAERIWQDVEEKELPTMCHYSCTLSYDVSLLGKGVDEKSINIDTYIVVVPATMATRIKQGSKILVFREKRDLDMESVLRASILIGLAESLVKEISRQIDGEDKDTDIILFYDTTHGINALLPPYSYVTSIIDQLVVLELAKKLLKTERSGSGKNLSYTVRSYMYNSDPVQLGRLNELNYVKSTSQSNVSYYYRTLMGATKLVINPGTKGERVHREMIGALKRLSEARGIIDDLVSSLLHRVSKKDDVLTETEQKAIYYIYSMYIAKLGMAHWAIKAFRELVNNTPRPPPLMRIEYKPNDYIAINYELNKDQYSTLPPHVTVTSLILGPVFAEYLLTLYETLESSIEQGAGKQTIRHKEKVCIRISTLKKLLESLDAKLVAEEKYNNTALALSALYTEIVEPGARILVLNELKKLLEENPEKILDHFLPRGFKLTIEKCPPETEAWEEVLGTKTLCMYPASSLPPSPEHIRNFIAHAGLTRLNKNWCLAIKIAKESKDKQELDISKCIPYAICIEKTLSKELLDKIAHP